MRSCRKTVIYRSGPVKVLCFSTWYALVHTGAKHACALNIQTKESVISFGFLFRRLLWRHRKTFNINAEKFYSRTVVYFTLADLLETNKVQEAKFRDCHWCISIHFASVYFDEKWADILKLLVVLGREKFRSFTQFQIAQRTTVHNLTMINNTWKL